MPPELKALWKEIPLAFKLPTSLTSTLKTCRIILVSECDQGLQNGCHEAMLSKQGLAMGFDGGHHILGEVGFGVWDKWSGWWSGHSIQCEGQSGQEKIFRFGSWKVLTFVSSLTGNLNLT